MITLRGIQAHYPFRKNEWRMVIPATLLGAALLFQDGMFETSRSFSALAQTMPQEAWGVALLVYAFVRLVALTVNGSFESFRYSPHMRVFASVVGMIFWGWFGWGFLSAAIYAGGALSAVIVYLTIVFPIEIENALNALADIKPRGA